MMRVTSNNALERQRMSGGRTVLAMDCALAGAECAPWRAAQQDRYAALGDAVN
jgi:hypothetical protein